MIGKWEVNVILYVIDRKQYVETKLAVVTMPMVLVWFVINNDI